ncbi:uncharacterized protein LOC132270839 [Cornus florida]|uniref:uncharacterized protein LOC132270839 n=1 Tax=Cornus florida TaxID=4283 RepID=UPI002897B5AB|nr:uncharacterized protein LOC132270839 [Cornus florida]
MVNPKKQQCVDESEIGDDRVDQSNDDVSDDSSSVGASSSSVEASSISGRSRGNGGSGIEVGLTERLTDILLEEGDGDLLLQQNDREDRVVQWLQALDLQLMGACRADERLKPLLKLNVSSGAAEYRLLAHLSKHFEPSEVGMLARCLCIPLVSVRVGKINKQGTILSPTSTRGNLNLTLLPTSDLRISFIGDDGHTERLSTLTSDSRCSAVAIEEIVADKSGRSFLLKIPDGEVFYFWCSEKSKLLGIEFLSKMKDLLKRKPSLAELTGISESRLDSFVTHLRAYLFGSAVTETRAGVVVSLPTPLGTTSGSSELCQTAQSLPASSKPVRSRHYSSLAAKTNSVYQGSLSPRSSSFKEGLSRNSSSLRSVAREKFRQRGDNSHLSGLDNLSVASAIVIDASGSNHSEKDELVEATSSSSFSPSSFLESLGKSVVPPFYSQTSHVSSIGSTLFSPYYCWCPPIASTLQYTVALPQLPISSNESFSLPPLSSLLTATNSASVLTSTPPLNLADVHSMDFPPFLPESPGGLVQSSLQFPTFTPFMCDPIVHIPVIDVCSSGQGYLVSAGPAISTTIPPLHPKLVNPLIPKTDSVVEMGAKETLRLLISSSSQTNPPLIDVMPSVLTNTDEKHRIFVAGSRGLYHGTTDVDAIASSITALGLVALSERTVGDSGVKRCISQANLVDQFEDSGGRGGSCPDDGVSNLPKFSKERND